MATTNKIISPQQLPTPHAALPAVKKLRATPAQKAKPSVKSVKVVTLKVPKAPIAPIKKAVAKAPVTKAPIKKAVRAKPVKTVAPVNTTRLEKTKKPKLVRDSFTIPKAEYLVLDDLKQRAAKLTRPAKKSELLRAGIKALAALSDAAFLTALEQVPAIKTGRPATGK